MAVGRIRDFEKRTLLEEIFNFKIRGGRLKKMIKILLVIFITLLFINYAHAERGCGDGVCDESERNCTNACPPDCENICPDNNQPVPPAGSDKSSTDKPTNSQNTSVASPSTITSDQKFIDVSTIKHDVRDKLMIIGFKTFKDALTSLLIQQKDGTNPKKLEIFYTSVSTSLDPTKYDVKSAIFTNKHVYLISGLSANTEYVLKILVNTESVDTNEELDINFTTSTSKDQQGTLSYQQPYMVPGSDLGVWIKTLAGSGDREIQDINKQCQDYKLNTDLCEMAGVAKEETRVETTPESIFAAPGSLAAQFFSNKLVFYGDIALLALVLILQILYLARSHASYGIVFNASDRKGIQGAIVRIFSEDNNKLLETKVTDASGKYSFLVKPGNYYLDVTKEGYRFPSKFITGKSDAYYQSLYRGEVLHIFRASSLLNPNIALDKAGETSQTFDEANKKLVSFGKKFSFFLVGIFRLILLILLTILNIGFVIIAYIPPLLIIAIMVAILWILEIYAVVRKGHY